MGFIQTAAEGALDLSLDRVRKGEDLEFNPRPQHDAQQEAELRAQQTDGRSAEVYLKALEYHGFVWRTVEQLPMLEGGVYRKEGEWRHPRLRLAFTVTDLAASFPGGAEDFDRYVRDQKLAAKQTRGRVAQADLRKSRLRK